MKKNNNKLKNFLYGVLLTLIIILIIFILIINSKSNKKDDKTLSYTDLIKQVSSQNVKKVEMVVGSTSLKVTLKNKIDENGQIIEQNQENFEIEKCQTSEANSLSLIDSIKVKLYRNIKTNIRK